MKKIVLTLGLLAGSPLVCAPQGSKTIGSDSISIEKLFEHTVVKEVVTSNEKEKVTIVEVTLAGGEGKDSYTVKMTVEKHEQKLNKWVQIYAKTKILDTRTNAETAEAKQGAEKHIKAWNDGIKVRGFAQGLGLAIAALAAVS